MGRAMLIQAEFQPASQSAPRILRMGYATFQIVEKVRRKPARMGAMDFLGCTTPRAHGARDMDFSGLHHTRTRAQHQPTHTDTVLTHTDNRYTMGLGLSQAQTSDPGAVREH